MVSEGVLARTIAFLQSSPRPVVLRWHKTGTSLLGSLLKSWNKGCIKTVFSFSPEGEGRSWEFPPGLALCQGQRLWQMIAMTFTTGFTVQSL